MTLKDLDLNMIDIIINIIIFIFLFYIIYQNKIIKIFNIN